DQVNYLFLHGYYCLFPRVVAVEGHRVVGAALRGAAQVGRVAEHAPQRDLRLDDALLAAEADVLDLPAAGVEISQHVADVPLGAGDLDLHDRLEQPRARLAPGVAQRLADGRLLPRRGRRVGPILDCRDDDLDI